MLGMKYKVALHVSDEGYAVSVPGLPGCWSQGRTEAEALDNIRIAIQEYLEAVDGDLKGATIREVEVAAWARPFHRFRVTHAQGAGHPAPCGRACAAEGRELL